MKEVVKIIEVELINEDLEKFTVKVFKVLDESFTEDFPDRKEIINLSRTLNNKLFNFLMDCLRDNEYVSLDFIKEELEKGASKTSKTEVKK